MKYFLVFILTCLLTNLVNANWNIYSCKASKFIAVLENENKDVLKDGEVNFIFRIDETNLKLILSGDLMFSSNPQFSIFAMNDDFLMAKSPTLHGSIYYDFINKTLSYSSNNLGFIDAMFAKCKLN